LFLMAGFLWFLIKTMISGPEPAEIEEPPRVARGRMRATPELLKGEP
jgi:hypothetical protein